MIFTERIGSMKPFLGTDITHNKHNGEYNGECFIIASPSEENAEELNSASTEFTENIFQSVNPLPLPLRIVEWITGIGGFTILSGILKSTTGKDAVSWAQGYQNAPILFWICGVFLPVWLAIFLYSRKLQKQADNANEESGLSSRLDSLAENIFFELGVPEDSASVDILNLTYKIKNGEVVPKTATVGFTPFNNFEMQVFVQDDCLCFSDVDGKYAIPLSAFTCIRTVNEKIVLPMWNKEIDCGEGIYRQYKLKEDNAGNVMVTPYHILEFVHEGETWGIYFPCYELPVMEELTGLRAE